MLFLFENLPDCNKKNSSLGVGVDFAGIVSDRLITWAAGGHPRLCRLKQLINRMPIGDVKACFDVLRDHNAIQNENASSDGIVFSLFSINLLFNQ